MLWLYLAINIASLLSCGKDMNKNKMNKQGSYVKNNLKKTIKELKEKNPLFKQYRQFLPNLYKTPSFDIQCIIKSIGKGWI